ncbi:MAG: UDP-N-acetylmuramoyl-L-alanine--D-glutamate ligase, partial [Patescibacteria group bacterium]
DLHPVILELSSWQLEQLEQRRLSPHIAMVTNMMEDHLNRYEGMAEYMAAKQHIYQYQKEDDYVILNFDNDITREFGKKGTPGQLLWFSRERKDIGDGVFVRDIGKGEKEIVFRKGTETETVCHASDIALPGAHNVYNSLAAITAAKLLDIPNEIIQQGLRSFPGVADRLEKIAAIQGREIYNDTTATTPDAVLAALHTLSPRNAKNIVLIAGGADKKLDYRALAPAIQKVVHSIVLLSGTATPKLGSELHAIGYKGKVEMANSMNEAVERAWRHTREGDIMLLSPGAASFGMFLHEFDRGAQFREAIARLQANI